MKDIYCHIQSGGSKLVLKHDRYGYFKDLTDIPEVKLERKTGFGSSIMFLDIIKTLLKQFGKNMVNPGEIQFSKRYIISLQIILNHIGA